MANPMTIPLLASLALCVALTLARYYDPPEVVGASSLRDIPSGHRQYACTFDNINYYTHGSVFRFSHETRCITYLCDRGTIYMHTEGCINDDDGMCTRLLGSFVKKRHECHYFMCTRSLRGGNYEYSGNRVKIECLDPLTDECRGESAVFEGIDEHGNRRQGCTCRISPNSTRINCPNWQA